MGWMRWALLGFASLVAVLLALTASTPAGDLTLPIPAAIACIALLIGGGFMAALGLEGHGYDRRCPQCASRVVVGEVDCAECGYSYRIQPASHPAATTPAAQLGPAGGAPPKKTSWPDSAVKLTAPDARPIAQDQPGPPIPVPNALQQPLMKRARVDPLDAQPPSELEIGSGVVHRFCTRCGGELAAGKQFCGQCGADLRAQRPASP